MDEGVAIMQRTEKNIAELILELARKTGASDSYVGKVRALLQQRGISLDEDSAPYRAALAEFRVVPASFAREGSGNSSRR